MAQSHGTALWREPAGSGATPSTTQIAIRDDGSSEWDLEASSVAQVIPMDLGNGEFLTVEVDAPWVVTDTGTEYLAAASGTAGAVLADDGAGGFLVAAVGATPAGQLLLDAGDGDVLPVRNDAPELSFVQLGASNILSYE